MIEASFQSLGTVRVDQQVLYRSRSWASPYESKRSSSSGLMPSGPGALRALSLESAVCNSSIVKYPGSTVSRLKIEGETP